MRGFTVRLLELFLARSHLLTQCLGINVRFFDLREDVTFFLSSMGGNFTAQLTELFVESRVACAEFTERLNCIACLFLIFRRFLQDIIFSKNLTHRREKYFVFNTLMYRQFIADLGNERALFGIRGTLFCDGIQLVEYFLTF
jgi:hypothetical protein